MGGSGAHPIIGSDGDDETPNMTVLALQSPLRDRRPRAPELTRRRFGQRVRDDRSSTLPQPVPTDLKAVKAAIENGTYVVDAAKVADKIVERLLDGRSIQCS
jgi:Anti-sigma-28 factor, FlgM